MKKHQRLSINSRQRLFFLTCCLLTALLLFACSPAVATETQAPAVQPSATTGIDSVPATESTVPQVEATQIPAVLPVATSRGDNLHATDPSTVSLASGQLQLVEFFRFT